MINYIQLAIAIVASLVVPMLALAAMWGKHTESVKNQHAKNIEQDQRSDKQDDKINALRALMTEREDILREHIDSRFNRLDSKLDKIFDSIK